MRDRSFPDRLMPDHDRAKTDPQHRRHRHPCVALGRMCEPEYDRHHYN
jgi:hypothetical protein